MADLGSIAITSNYIFEISSGISQQSTNPCINLPGEIHGLLNIPYVETSYTSDGDIYNRYIPVYAIDGRGYFVNTILGKAGININGTISGVVQENGLPVSGKRIALYYRISLTLISTTESGIGGVYSFSGLETGSSEYFIISLNDKPLQFDAVIHDTITAS